MMRKTVSKIRKDKKCESGFSLIELVITITILLIMLASATFVLISVNREFRSQKPRMEALNNIQTAVDSISRVVRMGGTKPKQCNDAFTVTALTPSEKNSDGSYSRLRVRADWNPADCALTGTDEDITISTSGGNLYLDAAGQNVFVDKIGAVKFRFFDSGNNAIADPVADSAKIRVVRLMVDTSVPGETATTISTDVRVRVN